MGCSPMVVARLNNILERAAAAAGDRCEQYHEGILKGGGLYEKYDYCVDKTIDNYE